MMYFFIKINHHPLHKNIIFRINNMMFHNEGNEKTLIN